MTPEQEPNTATHAAPSAVRSGTVPGPHVANRWMLLCGGFACLLVSAVAAAFWPAGSIRSSPEGLPDIVIDQTGVVCNTCSWDAGEVDPLSGREISRRFTIHNALSEDVRIEDISVDCGCLLVEEAPEEIKAGTSIDLAIRLNVGTNPGPVLRRAALKFAGAVTETVTLSFAANVKPVAILRSTPDAIDFGRVSPGASKERTVQLSYLDGSAVEISETTSDAAINGLTISMEPSDRTVIVRCILQNETAATLSQEVHTILHVRTPGSRDSALDIPLHATLEGVDAHFVRPLVVTLQGTETTVSVVREDAPVDVIPPLTGVRYVGDEGLIIALAPAEAAEGHARSRITVSAKAEASTHQNYRGVLYLTTAAHAVPEISVPLLVRSRP